MALVSSANFRFAALHATAGSEELMVDNMHKNEASEKLDQFLEDVTLARGVLRGYYRLLYVFSELMKKNGIEFFMHSGTMLGAVRHEGMIPWDDDVDVMIEEHYEEALLRIVPELRKYGLLLKKQQHKGVLQFKCVNPHIVNQGVYLQIDVFVGERIEIDGEPVIHYKSPKFREWFSKRYIKIADLYPLKNYKFGPLSVAGVGDYRNYFKNSNFDLDTAIVARHQGFDRFLPVIEELTELGVYPIKNHPVLSSTVNIPFKMVVKPLYQYLVNSKKKVVLTYGTYDLFHVGHVRLLKRLRALGDCLVVGISTDEFNASKGKKSFYSFEERKEILETCEYVDHVIPESDWAQKADDVKRLGASVFGMGDDWDGKFDELKEHCEVIYLPRTEQVSTTEIKSALAKIKEEDVEELEKSLHKALDVVVSLAKSVRG